jgi:phosphoribosyl-ATP pyrophosphohydrolase
MRQGAEEGGGRGGGAGHRRKGEGPQRQIWEAADLIYHQMVLREYLDLPLEEVYKEPDREA